MDSALSLRCERFDAGRFFREIALACQGGDAPPCDQVRYLASYLRNEESSARSMLIEAPYIDRHFLEEFTGYYATSFRPPPSRTTRIHFFKRELDSLRQVMELSRANAEALQDDYLGYAVIRPLAAAPVGRTVLRPYSTREKRRCFEAASTQHDVHLVGLTLNVEGIPFQQQDQGVGACASTALWAALARVTRMDGERAPTPLAVTRAATRTLVLGRDFPAQRGLEQSQLLEVMRTFGHPPDVLEPSRPGFIFELVAYLRSGIPVLLEVMRGDWEERHLLTAVGFRETDEHEAASRIEFETSKPSYTLRGAGISRLYAHDDRLGPYARMRWAEAEASGSLPRLRFEPGEPGFEPFEEPVSVWKAYAPLYPKLRMTARDLLNTATILLPLAQALAGQERRDRLNVELRFVLGGRYLEEVRSIGFEASREERILTTLLLPRYAGLIRFRIDGDVFFDAVCDTTDLTRAQHEWSSLLAFLPREEVLVPDLGKFASQFSRAPVL